MKKFFGVLILSLALISGNSFASQEPLKVVTSTTIFADLMRKIGGDYVKVETIASPKFNIHFIQPTPGDVRKTARADLFVFGGLDLEAWVDPLLEAAGNRRLFRGGERNLDLSEGVALLKIPTGNLTRADGDIHLFGNPHYIMNPENLLILSRHALAKLVEIDPEHEAVYKKNTEEFEVRLKSKIQEWKRIGAAVSGREVFSYHEYVEYFAAFLGFKAEMFLEPKPGIPPTPKHLAELEEHAQKNDVRVIVAASYHVRGNTEKLARRIHGKVAVIAQYPGEVKGTEDLFEFYDYNVRVITDALRRG